jgi:transposase
MNKKEIKLLKITYKKEKEAKIKERILMLIHFYEGKSSRDVGKIIQCDQKLVLYWKNRYEEEGLAGLKTRPRSGKPTLLSRRQEDKIKKKIARNDPANPWTTKRICDLIKKETGIKYTPRHVQRKLRKWDFNLLVPRPTFWQKASGEEIRNFWKKNPEIETNLPGI